MVYSQALEFFAQLVNLNVAWFSHLIGANLVWVFIFLALAFYIFPTKKLPIAFIFTTLLIYSSGDFTRVMNWVIFDPKFLALNSVVQLGVLMFAEADENLKKHFGLINTLRFITILSVFNLFLR